MLVRDLTRERAGAGEAEPEALLPYLEKVVAACIDAEFAAYAALPEIRLEEVQRWFSAGGVLRHEAGAWRVSPNLRPPPRSSVPGRWGSRRRNLSNSK